MDKAGNYDVENVDRAAKMTGGFRRSLKELFEVNVLGEEIPYQRQYRRHKNPDKVWFNLKTSYTFT